MKRMKSTTGPLIAVAVVVGLAVAGCGGSDGDTSGGKGNNSPKAAASNSTDPLVKYSQCMRSNGVPAFPDPVNGRLQFRVQKGSPMDPATPQYQAAQKACKALEPGGLKNAGQDPKQQEQTVPPDPP